MQSQHKSQSDWPALPTGAGHMQEHVSHSRHSINQPGPWHSDQLGLQGQLELHEHPWSGIKKQRQQSLSSEMPWTATKRETDQLVPGVPRAKQSQLDSRPHSEVSTSFLLSLFSLMLL